MKVACITRSSVNSVKGGDSTQFNKTIDELNKMGVRCDKYVATDIIDYSQYDLLHLFNIIRPADHLKHIKLSRKPYVVSTIYLDYSDFDRRGRSNMQRSVFKALGKTGSEYLKNVYRFANGQDKLVSPDYLLGHKKAIKKIIKNASVLLPNSHSEYKRLFEDIGIYCNYMAIPNGIDVDFYKMITNNFQREKKVISVGQVYGRKNQHRLIEACKYLKVPLEIIGKSPPNHNAYFDYCKSISDKNITISGYVSMDHLLHSYSTAWVHALPSWFETTGLSSLEAGVMGCNLVVGTGGDTKEYFSGHASFCDADDQLSITRAVEEALDKPLSIVLRDIILEKYTWKKAAETTFEAYQKALNDA